MSEEECLTRLIRGDRSAFNMIYRKFSRLLFCFSVKLVKDEQLAMDIVQDVFLKVWEKRKDIRLESAFSAYLLKIAHNHILNGIRKGIHHEKYKQYQVAHTTNADHTTENQIVFRDLFKTTQFVIDQLPEKRRQVFKLSRDHGLSNREIANQLHLSVRTVENHIHKALIFLKEKLVNEDIDNVQHVKQP